MGLGNVGTGSSPPPAVAAALQRFARIAGSGPSLVPKPGQYLSVSSVSDYASIAQAGKSSCVSYAVDHRHVWIAADGSGLLRDSSGPTTYPTPGDRARCRTSPRSSAVRDPISNLWFADQCFELGPGDDLQSLSTNPRILLQQMRGIDSGPRTPTGDLMRVADFLRETDASAALRAALYRAAALIPGIQLLDPSQDHSGRHGLGVALTHNGIHTKLIFDPHTAALIGEQQTGGPPGSAYWAVYLSSRIVDRQPYSSPVPLRPACTHGGGYIHQVPGGTAMTGQPVR